MNYMENCKIFTGIGTRFPPKNIENDVVEISAFLRDKGYILRSGGAGGMDSLFERPYTQSNAKEIYLPWKGFNKNLSNRYNISESALLMAEQFHPVWKELSRAAKLLHARNCYQVFGENLKTPSQFVLCYTKDGAENWMERSKDTGGTGTAIAIASYNDIPVINMLNKNWKERILELL